MAVGCSATLADLIDAIIDVSAQGAIMRYAMAAAAALLAAAPADAAMVTRAFEVTATDFRNFDGASAPFASFFSTFRLTYDDAGGNVFGSRDRFSATTDGKPDTGPFSVTPAFGYFPSSTMTATPRLIVGGAVNGTNMLVNGTNDFFLSFDANPNATGYAMMSFTTATDRLGFVATDARVVELPVTTAVPEPSAWMMMILGFVAMGLVLRRRSVFIRTADA